MRADAAKERLRKEFLETRREMTFEEVWQRSTVIQSRLLESPFFLDARSLALYSSTQNEVLTDQIFSEAEEKKKEVYYPRVFKGRRTMKFIRVRSLDELSAGAFDIREPEEAGETIEPEGLDLIVVPGVAFDLRGARLGFGKGFYDRALSGLEVPLVALAYDFQVRPSIPREPFDVSVKAIITEKRNIKTDQP